MKRILSFLRSMKFGMVLLILILICSLAGSLITQGSTHEYYIAAYPKLGYLLLNLGLDHVFSTWYFGILAVFLCVNLTLCSAFRFGAVRNTMKTMLLAAARAATEPSNISPELMEAYLPTKGFRLRETEAGPVWAKNRAGHFGSLAVHLSFLLLLIFAFLMFCFSTSEDVACYVGETAKLSDGTSIILDSFRPVDDKGEVDYISTLSVKGANGKTLEGETRVNHPLGSGGHKFYQYSYGMAGRISTIYNNEKDSFYVTNNDSGKLFNFGKKFGLVFYGLYPDYTQDKSGLVKPVCDDSNGYPNPIYAITLNSEGKTTAGFAKPGDTLTEGDISFTFGEVANYSVIRATTTPPVLLGCLYASFALIVAALWLCFFRIPIYIKIDSKGYAVRSMKMDADIISSLKALKKED